MYFPHVYPNFLGIPYFFRELAFHCVTMVPLSHFCLFHNHIHHSLNTEKKKNWANNSVSLIFYDDHIFNNKNTLDRDQLSFALLKPQSNCFNISQSNEVHAIPPKSKCASRSMWPQKIIAYKMINTINTKQTLFKPWFLSHKWTSWPTKKATKKVKKVKKNNSINQSNTHTKHIRDINCLFHNENIFTEKVS